MNLSDRQIEFLTDRGPTWLENLLSDNHAGGLGIMSKCIIGECHGWSKSYHEHGRNYCEQCDNAGYSLYHYHDRYFYCLEKNDYDGMIHFQRHFLNTLDSFIDHFEKCHHNDIPKVAQRQYNYEPPQVIEVKVK